MSFLQADEKETLNLSIVAEAATLVPNMMNVLVKQPPDRRNIDRIPHIMEKVLRPLKAELGGS